MKQSILIILMMSVAFISNAQTSATQPNNSNYSNLSMQLFGGVDLLSINYEHELFDYKNNVKLMGRVGLGVAKGSVTHKTINHPISVNFGGHCLIRLAKNYLDVGLGLRIIPKWSYTPTDNNLLASNSLIGVLQPSLGYRYNPSWLKSYFVKVDVTSAIELKENSIGRKNYSFGSQLFGFTIGKKLK